MTIYDSSALIAYLEGQPSAVGYVREHRRQRSLAPPLVLYEVYQGEVFKRGPAEFGAVDAALSWLTIAEATRTDARAAAELQERLRRRGDPLAARDAYIAGAALARDETLVATDTDFDVPGLRDQVDLALV